MDVKNNTENSLTAKVAEHIISSFSMPTISSIKIIEINMMYKKVKIV